MPFTKKDRSRIASRFPKSAAPKAICVLAVSLLAALCAGVLTPAASAQTNVTIESSPQLFATMCALYAAGYEAEAGGAGAHPTRLRLRGEMMALQGPAVETLRQFYRDHRAPDPAATLSRYVSFALVVGPPPKFEFLFRRDELPPDVLNLEGFNEVLASFYQEAGIARRWEQVRGLYEPDVLRLQGPVNRIVIGTTGYLRELLDPSSPRHFFLYVEPLVGAKTSLRSYGERYSIVLHAATELPLDDIRHSFLHFLLDPLAMKYRGAVRSRSLLLNYAARAPRLPSEYKDDFSSFLTECLVRATELRLRKLDASAMNLALSQADLEGFVLVRPFYRELQKFEKSEPAMTFYFPDLIAGINLVEEARRLEKMEFAPAAETARAAENVQPTATPEQAELDRLLTEGERQIAAQNAAQATAIFARVLETDPSNQRALYGTAVAAVLQKQPEKAKELFQRLVAAPGAQASPTATNKVDPRILAWSHVHLGRIHDVEGNRELALTEYRAALTIEGAPEAARIAARRGIERGFDSTAKERP